VLGVPVNRTIATESLGVQRLAELILDPQVRSGELGFTRPSKAR